MAETTAEAEALKGALIARVLIEAVGVWLSHLLRPLGQSPLSALEAGLSDP